MSLSRVSSFLTTLLLLAGPALAQPLVVPSGNRHAQSPGRLAKATPKRLERALEWSQRNTFLRSRISEVAVVHEIDPILIRAIVIAERTLSDFKDSLQTIAVRRAGRHIRFAKDGVDLAEVLQGPEFDGCFRKRTSSDQWDCAVDLYRRLGLRPDLRTLFDPLGVGFTFGIGQMEPLRALMLTDVVQIRAGLGPLSVDRPWEIYEHLLDQEKALHYIAANLRKMIEEYRHVGYDISTNPGIVATLYNLGSERMRARRLARRNAESLAAGKGVVWPEENAYGWFVNAAILKHLENSDSAKR